MSRNDIHESLGEQQTCKTGCSGLNRVELQGKRDIGAFNLPVYFVDICPNKSPLLRVLLMFLS